MAEYTEEQLKAKLDELKQELEDKFNDEVKGLKSTNAALKAEKQEAIDKAKADLEAKEQEAINAAREAGKFKEALELEQAKFERERSELSEKLSSRNDLILSSKKDAAVKGIVSNFAKNDKLSQLTASQLVDYGFGDDGNVKASYKDLDGNVVADNHDSWLEWAKKDPDMQNHLSGSQASGTDPSKVNPTDPSKKPELDRQAKIDEINSKFN